MNNILISDGELREQLGLRLADAGIDSAYLLSPATITVINPNGAQETWIAATLADGLLQGLRAATGDVNPALMNEGVQMMAFTPAARSWTWVVPVSGADTRTVIASLCDEVAE